MIKSIIVRFLMMTCEDEMDEFANAKYISGFTINGCLNDFYNMFMSMKECDIKLGDEYYVVDDVMFYFEGSNDSMPCINVYVI